MPLLTLETPLGSEFQGRAKSVTEERVCAFSGGFPKDASWPRKNIHTDAEFARSCGFETRVASGAMSEGFIAEIMIELFGVEWMSCGAMSLTFIAVVEPGDTVTAKVVLVSRDVDHESTKFVMDVWCENQMGAKVVVGTAIGRLGRQTR